MSIIAWLEFEPVHNDIAVYQIVTMPPIFPTELIGPT